MLTTTHRSGRPFFLLLCLLQRIFNPARWFRSNQHLNGQSGVLYNTRHSMLSNLSRAAVLVVFTTAVPADSFASTNQLEPPLVWQSEYFRDHPLVGTVWRGDGTSATWQELAVAVDRAQHVLVGEIHPNADHHQLQSMILAFVVAQGKRPTVVWEMIPSAQQPVLDKWQKLETPDAQALGQLLEWANSGWPAWSLYQPIAQIAAQNRLKMIGTALPRETMMILGRQGTAGVRKDLQERLHLDILPDEKSAAGLMKSLREGHCNLLPEEALAPMSIAQRARDGAMADAILHEKTEGGSVLIAGNGHIRKDWGVGGLLSKLAPKARSISIAQVEVQDDVIESGVYIEQLDASTGFDFLVFTPKAELTDYCAELRQKFGVSPGRD